MGVPPCDAIWSVLCPSSSATVRRSTPAITSLLAKVWRLQCQVYPSIFASSSAVGNQPRDPGETRRFGQKGKTGIAFIVLHRPCNSLRAATAIELRGIVRGSPFLVLGRWICWRPGNRSGSNRGCTVRSSASRYGWTKESEAGTPWRPALDGCSRNEPLRVGQESDAPSAFRLAANAGRRISVDLLVVDANSGYQRECRLPAIPAARCPVSCLSLFGQPSDDVALLD